MTDRGTQKYSAAPTGGVRLSSDARTSPSKQRRPGIPDRLRRDAYAVDASVYKSPYGGAGLITPLRRSTASSHQGTPSSSGAATASARARWIGQYGGPSGATSGAATPSSTVSAAGETPANEGMRKPSVLRTPVSTKDDSQPSSKPDATDPHVEIISRGEKIELIAISVGIVSLVMTVFFATWLLRTGWITSPVSRHYSDYYKSLASRDPSPHDEL